MAPPPAPYVVSHYDACHFAYLFRHADVCLRTHLSLLSVTRQAIDVCRLFCHDVYYAYYGMMRAPR